MSAVISDCGKYRYRLDRNVADEGIVILYCGVNPSTADMAVDDATVRKWIGFTKINGGRKFIAVNPFDYRSTDVSKLKTVAYPVGELHDHHVGKAILEADILVPCWGNVAKVPKHLRHHFSRMLDMMAISGKPVKTFGFTNAGDPKHPLFLSYSTPLVDY